MLVQIAILKLHDNWLELKYSYDKLESIWISIIPYILVWSLLSLTLCRYIYEKINDLELLLNVKC